MGFHSGWGSCSHITFVRIYLLSLSFKMSLNAILKFLDLNSDGFITGEEVRDSIIKECGEDYQLTEKDLEFIAIIGSFADADGKVPTKEVMEFFQLLENVETSSEENRFEALEKLFKFFDKNGDGKLSKVEASLGFSRIGRWEGKMENVFEELKGDDGKVSIEDLMNRFK